MHFIRYNKIGVSNRQGEFNNSLRILKKKGKKGFDYVDHMIRNLISFKKKIPVDTSFTLNKINLCYWCNHTEFMINIDV